MSSTILTRPSDVRRSRSGGRGERAASPLATAVPPATSPTLTTSTELMAAFKQAEVMAPGVKFEALQTTAGDALLFGISTGGAFSVTQEVPGQITGWVRTDLGATLTNAVGAKTRTFAVAQSQSGGTIDLALVITGATNDTLYLSLGNSASDTSWVQQPNWIPFPYDDAAHPLSPVIVNDVFINQSTDGESIVVDVLRDPSNPVPVVFRYYIDPKKTNGQAWQPHDVAGDLDASTVSSCLGRRTGDSIDGIYTGGAIGGHSQLLFQPLFNVFNPGVPANPVRLSLPAGVTTSALVAVSTGAGDNTTDLFVAAGQVIYYFPANGQKDGAAGVALLSNPLFTDVSVLFGYGSATEVIVWGLNRANQIFFVRCDRADVANSAAWSVPLPIVQGAENVAPYVNRANDGNTFFAHIGVDQLQRATRANDTTTWRYEDILLPVPPAAKAIQGTSYTTRIQVLDASRNPLAGVTVQISAQHRVGVFVNGLYFILDSAPIGIPTDALGAITVVEWTETVAGTPLTATIAGIPAASINPMAKPFAKAASFHDAAGLRAAQITAPDGSTRPLVSSSVSDDDLNVAASVLAQLQTVYQALPADGTPSNAASVPLTSPAFRSGHSVSFTVAPGQPLRAEAFSGFGDVILAAPGDLLSWLEGAASYVVHIVKDAAAAVWHFVVEIGGKAYGFVLDAIEQVVGAIEVIYRAIKTAIEDLIAFLQFLFAWKDFVRTKDVCKKLLLLSLGSVVGGLATAKADFDGLMQTARTGVDNWAGLKSDTWEAGVANSGQPMSFMESVSGAADILTAPAMFLYQHFIENVNGATGSLPGSAGSGSAALDRAVAALNNQSGIVIDAINRIKSTFIDGSSFDSMSLGDALQKLVAIVVDAFLNSTQNVVDALIDVFVMVAQDGIAALDSPIRIPVLSAILETFGVSINFSMFDVVMMVAAVPTTLGYKLANGSAPFPAGGIGDTILGAQSLAGLIAALGGGAPQHAFAADASGGSKVSPAEAEAVYRVGHLLSGIGAIISTVLTPGMLKDTADASYDIARTASGVVAGFSAAMASVFDSPVPLQNADMVRLASATSALTLAGKAAGWYIPRKLFGPSPTPQQTKMAMKVASGFDAVIAFLALTPTCYHFQELANAPTGSPRSSAIVNETANILSNLNRITTFFVTIDEEPRSKAALAATAGALMFVYGGLQIAEAAISPT